MFYFVFNFNEERANKHKLSSIFNTIQLQKKKKKKHAKNISYLKIELNQVSGMALPDCQLLCQVSENAILHPVIFIFAELFHIYKLIHID